VLAGPHALDVTRRLTWVTGCPALPPRWALAYSGSAMGYTDAADARALDEAPRGLDLGEFRHGPR
jgi:alpha-glucosidase